MRLDFLRDQNCFSPFCIQFWPDLHPVGTGSEAAWYEQGKFTDVELCDAYLKGKTSDSSIQGICPTIPLQKDSTMKSSRGAHVALSCSPVCWGATSTNAYTASKMADRALPAVQTSDSGRLPSSCTVAITNTVLTIPKPPDITCNTGHNEYRRNGFKSRLSHDRFLPYLFHSMFVNVYKEFMYLAR